AFLWVLKQNLSKLCSNHGSEAFLTQNNEDRKVFCFFLITFPRLLCCWNYEFSILQCPESYR
uniref:Uncharacterized protein n=1 Tax=Fundulus heteroclitus TaxID=8078 RepID=A0A3Q2Q6N0_FUNHE